MIAERNLVNYKIALRLLIYPAEKLPHTKRLKPISRSGDSQVGRE